MAARLREKYEKEIKQALKKDMKQPVPSDNAIAKRAEKMLTKELCFDYVIRFRGNIAVTAGTAETRTAAAWVQAWSISQPPNLSMMSACSTPGMKWLGESRPRRRCLSRAIASAPQTRPVLSATSG